MKRTVILLSLVMFLLGLMAGIQVTERIQRNRMTWMQQRVSDRDVYINAGCRGRYQGEE